MSCLMTNYVIMNLLYVPVFQGHAHGLESGNVARQFEYPGKYKIILLGIAVSQLKALFKGLNISANIKNHLNLRYL